MYRSNQTRNVPLRKDIARYLFHKNQTDIVKNPEYTLANICDRLPPDVLRHFAVFDIRITSRFTFETNEASIRKTFPIEDQPGNNPMRNFTNQLERPKEPPIYTLSQLASYRNNLLGDTGRMNDSVRLKSELGIPTSANKHL